MDKFKDWDEREYYLPEGKKVSWRPSGYAIIVKNNQLLLIRSKQHGRWELPGGGIEIGEKILDGLKREVLEESGYKIKLVNDLPIYFENNLFYAQDVDEYWHTILLFFIAKLESEEQMREIIHFEKEVHEVNWFGIDELNKIEINPLSIRAIEKYNQLKNI